MGFIQSTYICYKARSIQTERAFEKFCTYVYKGFVQIYKIYMTHRKTYMFTTESPFPYISIGMHELYNIKTNKRVEKRGIDLQLLVW